MKPKSTLHFFVIGILYLFSNLFLLSKQKGFSGSMIIDSTPRTYTSSDFFLNRDKLINHEN
ncbi:MAG: hypothetical protein JWN78_3082 [Bacteroidota bacterium]|nr:hypothetical protein [Bacteroidota bacterium]